MGSGPQEGASNGVSPVPTLAPRGGLSGVFTDFDHLPTLIADMDQPRHRPETIARWAALLEKLRIEDRHIDPDDYPVIRTEATLAADGAWCFAESMVFIASGSLTDTGRQVAEFAGLDAAMRQESLAPILAAAVEGALVGQGGAPILPLLRQAAQTLAESEKPMGARMPRLAARRDRNDRPLRVRRSEPRLHPGPGH